MARRRSNLKRPLAALAGALLLACTAVPALAVPANPASRTVVQPDGATLTLQLRGDEFQNWTELDETGYTVVHNPVSRYWEYAEQAADGSLQPSWVRAERQGRNAPAYIPKRVKPRRNSEHEDRMREKFRKALLERQAQVRSSAPAGGAAAAPQATGQWPATPVSGEQKLLIILVNYANRTLTTTPQSWHTKVFDVTSTSVARFYQENSRDAISIAPVPHTQPGSPPGVISVTLSGSHPNYGGTFSFSVDQAIGNSALQQAASYVDFDSYDTNGNGILETSEIVIYFVHAGYETSAGLNLSPSVWAHAWYADIGLAAGSKNVRDWALNGEMYSSATAMGIGVVAHELGHQFCGLPDLYDISGFNAGLGLFSIMASGSWGRNIGETAGYTPTLLDAWSREYLGWANPTLPAEGAIAFASPLSSAGAAHKLVKPGVSTTEYFLAENRHPNGWDLGLRGYFGSGWSGGLLVMHIDTNIGTPGGNDINKYVAGSHQGVVPVQARTTTCNMLTSSCSGNAATLFYAANNGSLTNTTTPNSRYYSGASTGFSLTGISAPGSSMTATFADGVPPTVTVTSPISGAVAVPVDSAVTATFDRAVTAATVTPATFTLSGGVSGAVSYDPATLTATFTPAGSLAAGTSYTATVSTGVTSIGGTPMAAPRVWSFTTLAPLVLTTATLPNGSIGTPYGQTLAASGGRAPYSWSIASGALPAGLVLGGATGAISGAPSANGVFTFSVRVTDADGGTAAKSLTLAIATPACANWPARLAGITPVLYPGLTTAYGAAADNDAIQLQALDFSGDLLLDRDLRLSLEGGYDCGYTANPSTTLLLGELRIANGTVKVGKLRIR